MFFNELYYRVAESVPQWPYPTGHPVGPCKAESGSIAATRGVIQILLDQTTHGIAPPKYRTIRPEADLVLFVNSLSCHLSPL